MNIKKVQQKLYNQVPMKILSFLSMQQGRVFAAQEVEKQTGTSKGAMNQALRLLVKLDIVYREQKGRIFLYKINHENVVLKQFKVFENVMTIQTLVKELQPYCHKIVLFGSYADGSNAYESDIDLFVTTEYKKQVHGIVDRYTERGMVVKPVVQDALEVVAAEQADTVFMEQVKKGIVLWEGRPLYEEV